MNLTISIPDELYDNARRIAADEKIAVEELFVSALAERIVEFERLKERASRGSYAKFQRVMSKVRAVEPIEGDRL
jgi:hypothetical protein